LIEKSTAIVHNHLDFIQFLFENPDKQPAGVDLVSSLVAVYDRDGVIVKASKNFQRITGITENDVQNGRTTVFDCINKDNGELVEAAKGALYNGTKYFEEIERPLNVKTGNVAYEMALHTRAAFFPIAHNRDRSVKYGAAVFLKRPPPDDEKETTDI